jgi:hypothetical protein
VWVVVSYLFLEIVVLVDGGCPVTVVWAQALGHVLNS